jgi:hypothetical protein
MKKCLLLPTMVADINKGNFIPIGREAATSNPLGIFVLNIL